MSLPQRTSEYAYRQPAPPPVILRSAFGRPAKWGTKAENLFNLHGRLVSAVVLKTYYFDVERWQRSHVRILDDIETQFAGGQVVVRSSAVGEDGGGESRAGAYTSVLDVTTCDRDSLEDAIEQVVDSYDERLDNQVLVQPMLEDVVMSGVLMTRDLSDGAPYFVINYDDESGKTDTVTGGRGINKTVSIYRDADLQHIESDRIRRLFCLGVELEFIYGGAPLDIEFAIDADSVCYLLQVRPITVTERWKRGAQRDLIRSVPSLEPTVSQLIGPARGLLGRRSILGIMPDWNPAELIGTTPGQLAVSLYRMLVTSGVWRESRSVMGYRALPAVDLMVDVGGRPYIDVRNSFNSFLPAGLDDRLGEKLVEVWLDRLDSHPELHDKIEFDVGITCLDFDTAERLRRTYGGFFTERERTTILEAYRNLTRDALNLTATGTLFQAEDVVRDLEASQASGPSCEHVRNGRGLVDEATDLLTRCRSRGTMPFAVLARHAFIAESLLRTAVTRGALSQNRLAHLRRSIPTITTEFASALLRVSQGTLPLEAFLDRFGHLRPGTYDITSLRYADRSGLIASRQAPLHESSCDPFELSQDEATRLDELLRRCEIDVVDAHGLIDYARRAIAGREYAKFVFTRDLSEALERIAAWGKHRGLNRDDLAHISLSTLLAAASDDAETEDLRRLADQGRTRRRTARTLRLGFLIRDTRDLYVVPQHRTDPNFIGSCSIEEHVISVTAQTAASTAIEGRVVCIENADPGFDWIFTRNIKGLITQYGGSNSHMAIRCAELDLPAAIGCGEQTFERIVEAGRVELDGKNKILRPIYGG